MTFALRAKADLLSLEVRRFSRATVALAVAVIFLSSSLSPTLAQSTRVTSGEHGDFSRIVIRLDRATEWDLRIVDGGYRIVFDPPASPLDLSRVFDLIPRDRISAITQSPEDGSVLIESDCECHAEGFDAATRTIAVDVKDGPGPKDDTERAANDPTRSSAEVAAEAVRARAAPLLEDHDARQFSEADFGRGRVPSQSIPAAPPFRRLNISGVLDELAVSGWLDVSGTQFPDSASAKPDGRQEPGELSLAVGAGRQWEQSESPQVSVTAEVALRDRLRLAGARGVIELREAEGNLWGARRGPDRDDAQFEKAASRLQELGRNIDLTSVFNGFDGRQDIVEDARPRCIPDHTLAFFRADAAFEGEEDSLSQLRAGLVDARGQISPQGARVLVEFYLARGFGAEAAVLAKMADLAEAELAMFLSLARIVDDTADAAPEVWKDQQSCDGAAALWSVLGQTPGLTGAGINVAAVQRAFFDLEQGLRLHLGVPLAERLSALGHEGAAEAILTNVAPLSYAEAGGAPELVPGAAEREVDDLFERVLAGIRSGEGVAADDLALAEALSWEYEGTAEGLKLIGMSALGRLQGNDLQGAMALLQSQWQGTERSWAEGLEEGLALVVMAKSDAQLLRFVVHPDSDAVLRLLDASRATEVATRLIDLGFPALARKVLDAGGPMEGPGDSLRARRVEARVSLELGDALRALALLAGLEDPASALIKAEAHSRLGNHALAAEAFALGNDAQRAARSAWMSGDEEAIRRFGSDGQRALTEALDVSAGLGSLEGSGRARIPTETVGAADGTPRAPADEAQVDRAGAGQPSGAGLDLEPALRTRPAPTLEEARALAARSASVRDAVSALIPADD